MAGSSQTQSTEIADALNAEEFIKERARRKLLHFANYVHDFYEPGWHHEVICDALDRFVAGETKRLMVFCPPQHGKSQIVSRLFPAFALGKNPDLSVIACSYASELSSRMNRDVQRIIDSKKYAELFPNTQLNSSNVRTMSGSWMRNSDIFEVVNYRGSYRSAGVGGGITGMGGDLIGIDDPVKNAKDAKSITVRNAIWEWYTTTLSTRMRGLSTGVFLVMTRWHEDDLAGRLLELAANDPKADQWDVISLPAINEAGPSKIDPRQPGQALWPERFPEEFLEKVRARGEYEWQSLYQQRPSSPQGTIIKRQWLNWYEELPKKATQWIQSWDCTFKKTQSGSYVVGQVWCKSGGNFYLVDQHRERMDFPETLHAIEQMKKQYPQTKSILIEDAANGPGIIASLRDKIPGIVPVSTKGESKDSRLSAVSHLFEAGNVKLPKGANFIDEYVEELVSFPSAPNDDQVDATSMALARYSQTPMIRPKLNMGIGLRGASAIGY